MFWAIRAVEGLPKEVGELLVSAAAQPTVPSSVMVRHPLLLFPAPGKLLSSASWAADMVMVVIPVVVTLPVFSEAV